MTVPALPLVVGSPRSGFALLCSVAAHILPMRPIVQPAKLRLMRLVLDYFGPHPIEAVRGQLGHEGLADSAILNGEFRRFLGGPKWLDADQPGRARVRKYIGVRGLGDFSLVYDFPSLALACEPILHSHSHPGLWLRQPEYANCIHLASVRNPVGIINSSLFSINALTSEYIQRFVPSAQDNDEMRQRLALYKFTDLRFFSGIARFYLRYFSDYLAVRDRYAEMRWEDLLQKPVPTIRRVARVLGADIPDDLALNIWKQIDHQNLTGPHHHNFRKGGGIVGGWKTWMTNRHLQLLQEMGFDAISEALGYGRIGRLSESDYSPFQQQVDGYLANDKIYTDPDQDADLFGFAFNKSNLDSEAFEFERPGWRQATAIERSSFRDKALQGRLWDCAEAAMLRLRGILDDMAGAENDAALMAAGRRAVAIMQPVMPAATAVFAGALDGFSDAAVFYGGDEPRLLCSAGQYNIVAWNGAFLAVPQAAGPIDLRQADLTGIDGLLRGNDFVALRQQVLDKTEVSIPEASASVPAGGVPPRLLYAIGDVNIVSAYGVYWAIPQAIGPLDMTRQNPAGLPGVISADTEVAVVAALHQAQTGKGGH